MQVLCVKGRALCVRCLRLACSRSTTDRGRKRGKRAAHFKIAQQERSLVPKFLCISSVPPHPTRCLMKRQEHVIALGVKTKTALASPSARRPSGRCPPPWFSPSIPDTHTLPPVPLFSCFCYDDAILVKLCLPDPVRRRRDCWAAAELGERSLKRKAMAAASGDKDVSKKRHSRYRLR